MYKIKDCLLIGHYDIPTEELWDMLSKIKGDSGTFRDLNLSVIKYNDKPYSILGLFNLLRNEYTSKPILKNNTLSSTISYLGSYLNKHNLSYEYILNVNEEIDELTQMLKNTKFLTIVITTTLYVVPYPIIKIIEIIRSINKESKIIIGGPFVETMIRTSNEEDIVNLFTNVIQADFIVKSMQGENTLVNLINAIKNNSPIENISNLYYQEKLSFIKSKTSVAEDNKINENLIKWELFNHSQKEFVNIRTAISCAFQCAFCGYPERAGNYQTLDVNSVEQQLNSLAESNKNIKSLYFIDDTFNVPPKRFKELLGMMAKNNYPWKWHSYFRCQFADIETVKLMKESGCEGVFLGIESGSDIILNNMNKKSEAAAYLQGIELLKNEGIITFGTFITGFPGETIKTIKETIDFIEKSGLDFYRTQLWFYEHITPIWKQRERFNIEGEGFDWKHTTMNSKIASGFVDRIFLDVKNSTWVPQYDYDWLVIWRLKHQGFGMDQIKHLFSVFNSMIKDKLKDNLLANVDEMKIKEFKDLLSIVKD